MELGLWLRVKALFGTPAFPRIRVPGPSPGYSMVQIQLPSNVPRRQQVLESSYLVDLKGVPCSWLPPPGLTLAVAAIWGRFGEWSANGRSISLLDFQITKSKCAKCVALLLFVHLAHLFPSWRSPLGDTGGDGHGMFCSLALC